MGKLKDRWDNSHEPLQPTLSGVYKIKMYPRWLWWWFFDRKWFIGCKPNINIAWGFLAWGKFQVYVSPNQQCQRLDYSPARWPWKHIQDRVKQLNDGTLLGTFSYYGVHIAMFTMEKVIDQDDLKVAKCLFHYHGGR
ncbi:MAG: hypothetical protein ACW99G_19295 [Candidatus Thorarchaeota archaeon]